MSKVVSISPKQGTPTDADLMARLDALEDLFVTGLQAVRSLKVELKKRSGASPALEQLLVAKQVAQVFGESERWVYKQAKNHKLPAIRVGKYWKFSPTALQAWLEQRSAVDPNPVS